MIKKLLLIYLSLACITVAQSQNTINGTITGLSNEKITLVQTFGNKQQIIDSSYIDENGSFKFILNQGLATGQYNLFTASMLNIDLIYNNEDIQFVAIPDEYDKHIQIIESVENMIYYDFKRLMQSNLMKLDILSPVIQFYPIDDEYYEITLQKVIGLRTELNERANELIENNPMTIASHFIKANKPVFADLNMQESKKMEFLKSHFFDHIDFNDTVLLKSNLLNSKVIKYLSLYQNSEVDRETFENNLLAGTDTILLRFITKMRTFELKA